MATNIDGRPLPAGLQANLDRLRDARQNNRSVSIGLMNGRTVVRTTSKFNLLLRLHRWLWNSGGGDQLHDEMKWVLENKGLSLGLRKQVFEEITKNPCPVFENWEAADIRSREKSYFSSAKVSVVEPNEKLYLRPGRGSDPEPPPAGKARFVPGDDPVVPSSTGQALFQQKNDEIPYEEVKPAITPETPVQRNDAPVTEQRNDYPVVPGGDHPEVGEHQYVPFKEPEHSPDEAGAGWFEQPEPHREQQVPPPEDLIGFEHTVVAPEPRTVPENHLEEKRVPEPDTGRAVFNLPEPDTADFRPVKPDELKPEQETVPVSEQSDAVTYEEPRTVNEKLPAPEVSFEPEPAGLVEPELTAIAQATLPGPVESIASENPVQKIADEQRRLQKQLPNVSLSDAKAFLEVYYSLAFLGLGDLPDDSAQRMINSLQYHFADTRQADGFADLEMAVMLKVLNDYKSSLSLYEFSGYLKTVSATATPNRHTMLVRIMRHIMQNGMVREESIHGHPREQVNQDHMEFLNNVARVPGACAKLGVALEEKAGAAVPSVEGLNKRLEKEIQQIKTTVPDFQALMTELKTL
ncbi:MAG: hypothetical protein ACR2PT_18020, partial [Endozoicomonas sp.]